MLLDQSANVAIFLERCVQIIVTWINSLHGIADYIKVLTITGVALPIEGARWSHK